MSVVIRFVFSLMLAVLVTVSAYDKSGEKINGRRYQPFMWGAYLPLIMLVMPVMYLLMYGLRWTAHWTVSIAFGLFVHMSVYFLILLIAMPFLRRFISSRVCAVLWVMPNLLYLTQYGSMEVSEPKLVVPAAKEILICVAVVWITGFVCVLAIKITEHFIYRRRILKGATEAADWRIFRAWDAQLGYVFKKKPPYKLVISPNVTSPLSVGFFDRSIRVVLPQKEYSEEELSMILRHELVHLSRADSMNKFFLIFCAALCWFNPLVWAAVKKSSEDIELSCDEAVLADADEEKKYKYADLLLKTADSSKGFTTCLSASARSLRYRLRAVTESRKKYTGAIIAGVVCLALVMSYGYITVAYGDTTGREIIYRSEDISEYHTHYVRSERGDFYYIDDASLNEYIAGLEMMSVCGSYSFDDSEPRYVMSMGSANDSFRLLFFDNYVSVEPRDNVRGGVYYLPQGADWDYIDSLMYDTPPLLQTE